MSTLLAIDSGNTHIKWGVFDAAGALSHAGKCTHDRLDDADLPHAEHVIIAHVAQANSARLLKQRFPTAHWFGTSTNAGELSNHYQATLGCDRWAAIIGAWYAVRTSVLVIDAGTATTIDSVLANPSESVLEQAQQASFLGGIILPGLTLMLHSLSTNTAGLSVPDTQTLHSILALNTCPRTTDTALVQGALHATLGAIQLAYARLALCSVSRPRMLLTGGHAGLLAKYLRSATVHEHLVLRGLWQSQQLGDL